MVLETEDSASEGAQSLYTYEGKGSSAWEMRSSTAAASVQESSLHPPHSATDADGSDSEDSDFTDAASATGSQSLVSR